MPPDTTVRVEAVGVRRGRTASRLLSFDARGTALEAEVVAQGSLRSLVGQVHPAPPSGGLVCLEPAVGTGGTAALDEVGRFRLDGAPSGLVRLHVEVDGATAVTTQWVAI